MICFKVPGKPRGKGRPRFARRGDFVTTYTPKETASYENLIALEFQNAYPGFKPYSDGEALVMTIVAYFRPPTSASKKKRMDMLGGRIWPTKRPDADNISKIVMDSLHGVCYTDDCCVVDQHIVKRYGEEDELVIQVREVDGAKSPK